MHCHPAPRAALKRTTFGLARPGTMEHVEKVRPQFLSLRQDIDLTNWRN